LYNYYEFLEIFKNIFIYIFNGKQKEKRKIGTLAGLAESAHQGPTAAQPRALHSPLTLSLWRVGPTPSSPSSSRGRASVHRSAVPALAPERPRSVVPSLPSAARSTEPETVAATPLPSPLPSLRAITAGVMATPSMAF
jgi:hypothetical protein